MRADHIIYFVHDVQRAKKFYTEILGLSVTMDLPEFVGLDLGGIWLGLHPTETSGEDIGRGGFVSLRVDDLAMTLKGLRERGVIIHKEIIEVPSGRIATIHDGDGNAIGLYEATK